MTNTLSLETSRRLEPYLEEGEEIRKIKGYDRYFVSNLGRVFSTLGNGRIMKNANNGRYYQVDLWNNSKAKRFLVHRLVAASFLPNPQDKLYVNHIDSDGYNNKLENLEWVTSSENAKHGYSYGYRKATHKKVIQLNLDGGLVAIRSSFKEAEEITGAKRQDIRKCILGIRKTAGGFKWREFSLEEAIEFLPNTISFTTGEGDLVITKPEKKGEYQIGYAVLKPVGLGDYSRFERRETLLEAVESMINYLLDHNLLPNETNN